MRFALAAALLLVGCDSDPSDGICRVGPQPAFELHDVDVRLFAPTQNDTVRLGEPFPFRARLEARGPELRDIAFGIVVIRDDRFSDGFDPDTLFRAALDAGVGVTEIDTMLVIEALAGGVTSEDLGPEEYLAFGLSGAIRYPVVSEGPGCGTTLGGEGPGGPFVSLTVLAAE